MDKQTKFAQTMKLLTAMTGKEILEPLQEFYWELLEPYTDDETSKALDTLVQRHSRYNSLPLPSELIAILPKIHITEHGARLCYA
jgi:hypothetical protein